MAKADAFVLVWDPIPPTTQNMVVRLEVHGGFDEQAPRKSVEVRYTEARGEGSCTADPRTNVDDLKKNRRIERLEKELRELKGQLEDHDRQRLRRRRSQSHSGSCESSHRFPGKHNRDHRAYRNSWRSRSIGRARRSPLP
jgi:hypothetical protein